MNDETIPPVEKELKKPKKKKDRIRAFVATYPLDWNATQAAIRAGYSKKTAYSIGSRLLRNVEVRDAIERALEEKAMGANEVLFRLSVQARANLMPFVRINKDGFVEFDFSDPDAHNYFHLIKKVKTKRRRIVEGHGDDKETWEHEWVEVELHDAQKALEDLGKHHNLFNESEPKRVIIDTSNLEEILKMMYGGRHPNNNPSGPSSPSKPG